MGFSGSDFLAGLVVMVMILGPMAAGAKKGLDEHITRDTPVMPTPDTPPAAPATPAAPASPAK